MDQTLLRDIFVKRPLGHKPSHCSGAFVPWPWRPPASLPASASSAE